MPRQDMFDDSKAKAGALLSPARLQADPVESLGKPRYMFVRDARPEILNRGLDDLAVPLQLDDDLFAGLAVFAGVFDEVLEDLRQFIPIAKNIDWPRIDIAFDLHAKIGGERPHASPPHG